MVYDVYLFCELYLLSLKIFIFVSFKNKFFFFKRETQTKYFLQRLPKVLLDPAFTLCIH